MGTYGRPTFTILAALRLAMFRLLSLTLLLASCAAAQKLALITPDSKDKSRNYAEAMADSLEGRFTILDQSMSSTAFGSAELETPFNLTAEKAAAAGAAMGCDIFVLLRADTLRRSAFGRPGYYESYAAIYIVSTRTGRLLLWKISTFEAPTAVKAELLLRQAVPVVSNEIADVIRTAQRTEVSELLPPLLEEPPAENSRNFRAPIPYRRIKPEYTNEAALYDVTATVEVLVDLDANGTIQRTRIVRWAGFGLDESVDKTVREMNWRPAERNGKSIPMRFLLRYNFKKPEREKTE
jgi:TonB family protein